MGLITEPVLLENIFYFVLLMNIQSHFGLENTETTDLVRAVGLNRNQSFEEVTGKYAFAPSHVFNVNKIGVLLVHVRSTALSIRG